MLPWGVICAAFVYQVALETALRFLIAHPYGPFLEDAAWATASARPGGL